MWTVACRRYVRFDADTKNPGASRARVSEELSLRLDQHQSRFFKELLERLKELSGVGAVDHAVVA